MPRIRLTSREPFRPGSHPFACSAVAIRLQWAAKRFATHLQRHSRGEWPLCVSMGPLCGEPGRCQAGAGGGRGVGACPCGYSHGGKRVARATRRRALPTCLLRRTAIAGSSKGARMPSTFTSTTSTRTSLARAPPGRPVDRAATSPKTRGKGASLVPAGSLGAGGTGNLEAWVTKRPVGRAPASDSSLDRASVSAWAAARAPGRHRALSDLRGRTVAARRRADEGDRCRTIGARDASRTTWAPPPSLAGQPAGRSPAESTPD